MVGSSAVVERLVVVVGVDGGAVADERVIVAVGVVAAEEVVVAVVLLAGY